MTAPDTSVPLDLDAIEARARDNADFCTYHLARKSAADVPALVAEVRRLRGQFAACVEALGVVVPPDATAAEAIVHEWQMATGEARAMRMARDAAEEETARVRELFAESADAFDRLVIKVWRAAMGDDHEGPASVDDLIVTMRTMRATARREGAEAMREACAKQAEHEGTWDIAAEIRALPLPEVNAGQRDVTAYQAGAEAMREACVDALNAMAHAEGVDAERFRLTRGDDSAAEHHHKRAALLEARVAVLGLPLPKVTP